MMLRIPVPKKHQMSRIFICRYLLSKIRRNISMDTAVTIALNETIPIEASPCPFRVRTKSPILPQSMPASNIRNGAALFKLFYLK